MKDLLETGSHWQGKLGSLLLGYTGMHHISVPMGAYSLIRPMHDACQQHFS